MSRYRFLAVSVFMVIAVAAASSQVNQVSATIGRTFISSQDIVGATFPNHTIHFGNGLTFAGNYGRLLKSYGIFGIVGEASVAYSPDIDLNTGSNLIPEAYQEVFVTPALRVNIFHRESVSPWFSVGGGYGFYRQSHQLLYGGTNPGKTSTNTGIFQFGAGLDVFPWQKWGFRLEARDYWSGVPDLNVTTVRTRQHNVYVGGGVIRRW